MNSAQQTLYNNIDLHRLMVLCRKHIKLLVIWTILAGIIGFVAAEFVVTPKYTATTEILVNQKMLTMIMVRRTITNKLIFR